MITRKTFLRNLLCWFSICLILIIGVATPRSAHAQKAEAIYQSFEELEGKIIAGQTGTVYLDVLNKSGAIKTYTPVEYNTNADRVNALLKDEVNAVIVDWPVAQGMCARHEGLAIMPVSIATDAYGIAFEKGNTMEDEVARLIEQFKQDGTLKKLQEVWFSGDESLKKLPELDFSEFPKNDDNTIHFGYSSGTPPMSYADEGGNALGYDIALAMHIAHALGMHIKPISINVASIVPALDNGMVDMAGGALSITEKRLAVVNMIPYFENRQVFVVKDVMTAPEALGISGQLAKFLHSTFIKDQQYVVLAKGIAITIVITLISALIGLMIGIALYQMKLSGNKFMELCIRVYMRLFEGRSTIILCLVLYYVIVGKMNIYSLGFATIGFGIKISANVMRAIENIKEKQLSKLRSKEGLYSLILICHKQLRSLLTGVSIVVYIVMEKLAVTDWASVSSMVRRKMYIDIAPWIATAVVYFGIIVLLKTCMSWVINTKKKDV